ncbi:hypothetical protein [Enterovirga aerilata]|uniref:Uncharacterized protein n=1 Tax=Enterovirga aerilata TaxID=2730920 RepID=A0A849IGE5_9HYPH|nr:hypothetical protein [Enterovirga sp. DB1703]NNM75027.1 hypothetical protein [Enterovirga sp. DB1703]
MTLSLAASFLSLLGLAVAFAAGVDQMIWVGLFALCFILFVIDEIEAAPLLDDDGEWL